jgi:hypothetical protein
MICCIVAILANKPSRNLFSCRQHLAIYLKLIYSIVAKLATRVPPQYIFNRQHEAEFIFSSPIWRYIATISSTGRKPRLNRGPSWDNEVWQQNLDLPRGTFSTIVVGAYIPHLSCYIIVYPRITPPPLLPSHLVTVEYSPYITLPSLEPPRCIVIYTDIFNAVLGTGRIPPDKNVLTVTPVVKDPCGGILVSADYRPISCARTPYVVVRFHQSLSRGRVFTYTYSVRE